MKFKLFSWIKKWNPILFESNLVRWRPTGELIEAETRHVAPTYEINNIYILKKIQGKKVDIYVIFEAIYIKFKYFTFFKHPIKYLIHVLIQSLVII